MLADWKQQETAAGPHDHRRGSEGDRLARRVVTAEAGAGAVKVRVDGNGRLRGLLISAEAFAERDAELLADLVLGAVAEAQRRAEKLGESPNSAL